MKSLEKIIEYYNDTRESYKNYITRGSVNKDGLIDFQSRFNEIKADLTPWKSKFTNEWVRRDDKSATAIKFRIAVAITNGTYKDADGKPLFEKCTITNAEKYASASKEYQEFVDQRAEYKEYVTNLTDLREDCNSYSLLINNMLKDSR